MGTLIDYYLCPDCGFCFAPDFASRSPAWFKENIYNGDYAKYDPEALGARAAYSARMLINAYSFARKDIWHLDYGCGKGHLTQLLQKAGFDSTGYDPFYHVAEPSPLNKFNLITAYEVFEHVPWPLDLLDTLLFYLENPGVIIFSTLVSDGEIVPGLPLDWWYAAPRNGHISLFSTKSLQHLAASRGLTLYSMAPGVHALWRELPTWAEV